MSSFSTRHCKGQLKPCGGFGSQEATDVWQVGAVRRTRRASGAAKSRSNVAELMLPFYGRQQFAGGKEHTNGRLGSSPATAPSEAKEVPLAFQAFGPLSPGNLLRCTFLALRPGMSGDLEIAERMVMSEMKQPLVSEALKLVRLYWGFSQAELAERLSISQSMISDIERGTKSVSLDILERYSKKLGIRMSQLLFFAEELDGQPLPKKGRLIVASHVLDILRNLAPKEISDASA